MAKFEKFDSKTHIAGLAEAARQIQAEELIRDSKMPSLEEVVAAIEETRREYGPRVAGARQKRSLT
jgi:hypothetical protein